MSWGLVGLTATGELARCPDACGREGDVPVGLNPIAPRPIALRDPTWLDPVRRPDRRCARRRPAGWSSLVTHRTRTVPPEARHEHGLQDAANLARKPASVLRGYCTAAAAHQLQPRTAGRPRDGRPQRRPHVLRNPALKMLRNVAANVAVNVPGEFDPAEFGGPRVRVDVRDEFRTHFGVGHAAVLLLRPDGYGPSTRPTRQSQSV
jgi:hypothetical protein